MVPIVINDRAEIAGTGFLLNGDAHAFLLIPCDEEHADSEVCEDRAEGAIVVRGETNQRPNVVLPESVRKVLQRPQGPRSHIRGFDTPKN